MPENDGAMNNHGDNPPLEYHAITDQILLGTNGCCKIHFADELLDQGITADISMEEERLDAAQGATYFLWLPTKDHTAPSLGQLRVGTHTLRELVDSGEKVYVHCRNGHGRGPSLVIAYFILLGDDYETAHEKVRSKRDSIHLDDIQIERLMEFAKWCREEHSQDAE